MRRTILAGMGGLTLALLFGPTATAQNDLYSRQVLVLNPTHYYRLDETDPTDPAANIGSDGTPGTYWGNVLPAGSSIGVNDRIAEVEAESPTVDGFAGLGPDNTSFYPNDGGAVKLGDTSQGLTGTQLADPVMTVSLFFKSHCNPLDQNQGCTGPPASSGGERLWSNNTPAIDAGGDFPDIDDGGHFQIDYGWGANLVVSIDHRHSAPLKSNFQMSHGNLRVKNNQWHHLVVSRNGDDINNVLLTVDGVEISDLKENSTDSWGTTAPFDAWLGNRTEGGAVAATGAPQGPTGGGSRHAFNGWLDENAIWLGTQLNAIEAASLYYAGVGTGDLDSDQEYTDADIDAVSSAIRAGENTADMNGDGDTNQDDHTFWVNNITLFEFGDANLDRRVTAAADGGRLLQGLGLPQGDLSWGDGDFNGDGLVQASTDGATLLAALSGDTSAVPEPGTLMLLVLAGLALIGLRRRTA